MIALLLACMANLSPPPPALPSAREVEAQALTEAIAQLNPAQPDDPAWRDEALAIRQRARLFSESYPEDSRGIEASAMLSVSLADDAGVDADLRRVLDTSPEKTSAGLIWSDYWLERDPARAIDILEMLIDERPEALIYINRLMKILIAEAPPRILTRFERYHAPDANLEQAAIELDLLSRLSPPIGVEIGNDLLARHPDHTGIAVGTARGYRTGNRFADARLLLDNLPENSLTDPGDVYLWSDTYYADHHFDRAWELLSSIDMEALAEAQRPGLHRRLKFMLPLRQKAAEVWPAEQQKRHNDAVRGDNPMAILRIGGREVIIELFEDDAPNTVANFIAAADLQLYDGWAAGQVHTGFRTILGDRHEEDGLPGWTIAEEHELPTARPIVSGSLVAYKTSRPLSTDTTFFIMHFPGPHLNGMRTCFGRVVSGLDVIREMNEGDIIDSIEVLRRRDHDYDPVVYDDDQREMMLSELLSRPASDTSSSDNP